eukprot:TRINITY_DN29770_c0_g1_i3.p1 TRINITY_DN29770_c0_g1~~TRINITY_DN29770_c0_g1_i3.p1  ORF type:complete len:217 (+),score=47.49 TRINITY_DN29770_c0_g1_i3:206-856(+)
MHQDEERDRSRTSEIEQSADQKVRAAERERDVAVESASMFKRELQEQHHTVMTRAVEDRYAVQLVERALDQVRSMSPGSPLHQGPRSPEQTLSQSARKIQQVDQLEEYARAKATGDAHYAGRLMVELGEEVGGVPTSVIKAMTPGQVLSLTQSARREIEQEEWLESGRSVSPPREQHTMEAVLGEAVQLLSSRSSPGFHQRPTSSPALQEFASLFG